MHIRPIKLPAKTRQPIQDGSNLNDEVFKKPQKTTNNSKKNSRPGASPLNRNKSSKTKTRSTTPRPGSNRKRPRICQRLVVNCKTRYKSFKKIILFKKLTWMDTNKNSRYTISYPIPRIFNPHC